MPEAVAPIQRLSALADTKSEKARTAMGAPQYVDVDASVAFNGYHDSQNVLGMADVPVAQEEPIKMRVLLVDNYDSYTYNLLQICEDAADLDSPVVIRNDQFDWETLREHVLPHFDCVIISPGPGTPEKSEDFGVCRDIILKCHLPVLGVCLGHQGIASCFGAKVVHAVVPMHGRLSSIRHEGTKVSTGTSLFSYIPQGFNVVRYHSLVVLQESLPECLKATAWAKEDNGSESVMALEHTSKPLWGVQFHPESICTEYGAQLLRNFRRLARNYIMKNYAAHSFSGRIPLAVKKLTTLPEPLLKITQSTLNGPKHSFGNMDGEFLSENTSVMPPEIVIVSLEELFIDSQKVFLELFGSSDVKFWLDSAKVEAGRSRFSYMGSLGSRYGAVFTYSTETRAVTLSHNHSPFFSVTPDETVEITLTPDETFFHWASRYLGIHKVQPGEASRIRQWKYSGSRNTINDVTTEGPTCPVFPFLGGLVGYFGYEMKVESLNISQPKDETDGDIRQTSSANNFKTVSAVTTPDAAFMFVDRFLVFDHELRQIYIVSLERSDSKGEFADLKQWCLKTIERIKKLSNSSENNADPVSQSQPRQDAIEGLKLAHRRDLYIENIRKSLAAIKEGETYEVCLTTQIKGKIPRSSRHPEVVQDLNGDTSDMSVLGFYLALRARNAAPYASFLDFGKRFRRLTVAGSSPERFLQCDNKGWVEMKPIKGTLARPVLAEMGGDIEAWKKEDENRKAILEANEKDRAENLMIVDLIRNDLNLICDPKTVSVPHLMKVETYATVHQLVTTVRGSLRPNLTCIDAIRATFPPGSMTGAPKLRTCQILEDLEGYNQPRGPYSGCLGFLSISGSADMSVVIRTAVFCEAEDDKDCLEVRVGAGGAVVFLSDPAGEYDEMLLKANSVLPSLAGTFGVKLRQ